jgi:rhodanese-related sulfurtransferase
LLEIEKNPESIYNMGAEAPAKDAVSVQGKQSIKTTKIEQQFKIEITDSTDFLLIDLRQEEDYAKYHIKDSTNFPASLIPRDKYPHQMYLLKNKPNKLIVMIHEDERLGVQFATALYQKGFDNIYLVTGGMEEFYQKHPQWVQGTHLPVLKSEIGMI